MDRQAVEGVGALDYTPNWADLHGLKSKSYVSWVREKHVFL